MRVAFRLLWLGQAFSNLADVLYIVVTVTFLYKQTGSATLSALFPFIRTGSMVLSGLLVPLVLDRVRLQRLLVFAQVAQCLLLAGLALLLARGHAPLLAVGALVFVLSFAHGWINPARNALVPRLVVRDRWLKANSLLATTDQTVALAGWSLGGMLAVRFGSSPMLWVAVTLLGLAAGCFLLVGEPPSPQPQAQDQVLDADHATTAPPADGWASIRAGWLAIWQRPVLRILSLMDILEQLAGGVWAGAIILVFVQQVLHRGEDWWGYINTSYFVGLIAGGVLVGLLGRRVQQRLFAAMVAGSFTFSLLTLGFAYTSVPLLALLLCVVMGPAMQLRDIGQRTLVQQEVDGGLLPRVLAAQDNVRFAMYACSLVLMGVVADNFGIRAAYILAAVLVGSAALLAFFVQARPRAAVDSGR